MTFTALANIREFTRVETSSWCAAMCSMTESISDLRLGLQSFSCIPDSDTTDIPLDHLSLPEFLTVRPL